MFEALLKPLTLSHMDANGLFGTTKGSVFQLLLIYDSIKHRVRHMRPEEVLILFFSQKVRGLGR